MFLNIFIASVNNELRNIEGKRQKLLSEITINHQKIEDAKAELVRQEVELEKLKISVKQVNNMTNKKTLRTNDILLFYFIFRHKWQKMKLLCKILLVLPHHQ